ncbi:MAG: hypothetical protein ABSG13_28435 [Bryobacteraceae bacterium]
MPTAKIIFHETKLQEALEMVMTIAGFEPHSSAAYRTTKESVCELLRLLPIAKKQLGAECIKINVYKPPTTVAGETRVILEPTERLIEACSALAANRQKL